MSAGEWDRLHWERCYGTTYPPRIPGLSRSRRIEIEQAIARTGSLAAAMELCEVSYETVHTLMEWMAA